MAIKVKFTDSFVQKLELLPAGQREVYQDVAQPNLCLRLTSTSKKLFLSFRYQYKQYERNLDEQRNVFQARLEVEQRKVEIRSGNERLAATKARIVAEKVEAELQAAEAVMAVERNKSLGEAVEAYIAARTANVADKLHERTVADYRNLMKLELSPYKDLPLVRITREKSIQMLNEIATDIIERSKKSIKKSGDSDRKQRTGVRASYALRLVRSVCNFTGLGNQKWGNKYPWIKGKPKVTSLDPEFGHGHQIWSVLGTKRKDTGADFLKAVLLTGGRRGELADLTVGQVNLKSGEMIFRDTKNGTDHRVFISPQLNEVLEPLLKDKERSERVFPTTCDPRKLLKSVSEEIGVEFSTHSLRKFFAINCMTLGIPFPVIKACLNHSLRTGDVTMAHYAMATPSQMKSAWLRHADSIAPQSADVISLDAHRRSA